MREYKSKVPDGAAKVKCTSVAGSKYDGTISPTEYADDFTVDKVYDIIKLSRHFVPMVKSDKGRLLMVNMKNFDYLDIDGNVINTSSNKPFVYKKEPSYVQSHGIKCCIMIGVYETGELLDGAKIHITLPALPMKDDIIMLSDKHLDMFTKEFIKLPENKVKYKQFYYGDKLYFGDANTVKYRWFNSDSDEVTVTLF